MPVSYLKGDATHPEKSFTRAHTAFIVHICNNAGGWGAGFVLALSKRWPEAERAYRDWFKNKRDFELGRIGIVHVEENITVINMIAQHGFGDHSGPPIRYAALQKCLRAVADEVHAQPNSEDVYVCMPRIGCGLAGGKWEEVLPIIERELKDINVLVYDL